MIDCGPVFPLQPPSMGCIPGWALRMAVWVEGTDSQDDFLSGIDGENQEGRWI